MIQRTLNFHAALLLLPATNTSMSKYDNIFLLNAYACPVIGYAWHETLSYSYNNGPTLLAEGFHPTLSFFLAVLSPGHGVRLIAKEASTILTFIHLISLQ